MKTDTAVKVGDPVTSPYYEVVGVVRSFSEARHMIHDAKVFDEVREDDTLAVVEWATGARTVERPNTLIKAACTLPFTFPWL